MEKEQVIEELKALKEAFEEERDAYPICLEEAIRLLEQPEIIRCMECIWYHVLIEPQYAEYCELTECAVFRNDFCSRAERRTDEGD